MRILVLSDNFTPEIVASSFRTHEHAKVWLAEGHEVTVVTCVPNWPYGKVFTGYRNRPYQTEFLDGIRVIRVWSYTAANRGFLKRSLDYVSYMASAVAWCWRYPRFDVVLATSPQFFTSLAGFFVSILRRRPWVFELRDLWPDSIQAVGAGKGRFIRWLEKLELFLYRRSARIVALTHAFRDNLTSRGIRGEKIDVVTNGVDLDRFDRRQIRFDARQRLGMPSNSFLAAYVGTVGMAHGLETLLEAARLCQDQPHIQFLIMGDGAERERLERLACAQHLTNLRFVNRVPHDEMPSYLAAIDLAVIHLRPDPLFRTVIPSKLFEFMAMQRPVLMAVEGESAEIVRRAGCGVCIPSGDPLAMAEAVKYSVNRRETLVDMGVRGRRIAERMYSREAKARAVLQSLKTAVAMPQPAIPPQTSVVPAARKAA